MNSRNIITIWKKEIKDTVRDRRTLFSMILIPMLLMPVIMVGMFKLIESQQKSQEEKTVKVAIANEAAAPEIVENITKDSKIKITKVDGDLKTAVQEEKVDAAVVIPQDFQTLVEAQKPVKVEFLNKSTNLNSASVFAIVSAAVAEYDNQLLGKRFNEQGINPDVLSSVTVASNDVATQKETSGFILGLMIPIFIVIWSIVGGQYTAIDVSAGEKERKTLEALFLTPARRIEIVLGKFLAVATVALTSIVIAIGSLYVTFLSATKMGVPMSGNTGGGDAAAAGVNMPIGGNGLSFSVEPQAAILLFAVSIFLVLMFSAMVLSISIFAKSFKEAESYIGPAYMIVILPVVFVNAVPGFEPALMYFGIPPINAVLLFKEVLMGVYDINHIILTFISLIICSALAILVATKIYSKESVLFSS